jgi:LacI family transcriptional regulator
VRHLVAQGHQRIAMITGPARNHDAAERLRGYREALSAAGIEPVDSLVVEGDFRETTGHDAALALLELDPRPTAIFAANDSMAIGALSALRERGVRVPADMAVAGFDDIPMARYMNPPLSTVHVDISELGRIATERLLARLDGSTMPPEQQTVSATLVVRDSCGGVRGADDAPFTLPQHVLSSSPSLS